MEMSAMTTSASSNPSKTSARMLPARAISCVVRPSSRSAFSTGAISSRSTRSKSTPSLVPNGLMMNARMRSRLRCGERPEMGEVDESADGAADLLEIGDVVDRVHLPDPGGVDVRELELLQAVLRQLGVVAAVEERLAQVLVEGHATI